MPAPSAPSADGKTRALHNKGLVLHNAPMPTVLEWLEQRYPSAKRTTFRRMIGERRVRVNDAPAASLKQEITSTDTVTVDDAPRKATTEKPLPFEIVHEDPDLVVINKPAGLLTSTVPREWRPTAAALLREYLSARDPRVRLGVIHRLDRDASGLLVFSKNNETYESLKRQFFEHSVDRVYMAVVERCPNPRSGKFTSLLVELPDGRVRSSKHPGKGERAVTHYETLRPGKEISLIRVRLETGRKHQIRAQFAERGWPIVNDPLYSQRPTQGRLMLVATELAITHPRTGERLTFTSPLPREMTSLFSDTEA